MDGDDVRTFDSRSWVCVFCLRHSDVVQMTSSLADETVAKMYAKTIADNGGHVFRCCTAGELIAALYLIRTKGGAS